MQKSIWCLVFNAEAKIKAWYFLKSMQAETKRMYILTTVIKNYLFQNPNNGIYICRVSYPENFNCFHCLRITGSLARSVIVIFPDFSQNPNPRSVAVGFMAVFGNFSYFVWTSLTEIIVIIIVIYLNSISPICLRRYLYLFVRFEFHESTLHSIHGAAAVVSFLHCQYHQIHPEF